MDVELGNGDGTFTYRLSLQPAATALVAADFDGDGVSDLAVTNDVTDTVNTLLALTVSATANVTGVTLQGAIQHAVTASYGGDDSHRAGISNIVSLVAAQDTSLTLTATPAGGSSYGQLVSLMAVLTPNIGTGIGKVAEAVLFFNGTEYVGATQLFNGQATLNLTTLPRGVLSLTAVYYGDGTYKPSTSVPLRYVVAPLVPQISFAVANQVYGVAPFAVSATSDSPGTITYSVASGPATIAGNTVTLTGSGTVVLLASQAASGGYAAGSQTATFAVSAPLTMVTLRLLSTKLVYPLPTIFEVSIGLRGKVVPTGSVQLLDGATVVGTYPVFAFLGGYAFGLTPQLTVGPHTLTARYLGDQHHAPGVSAPVAVTVSAGGRR